MLATNAKDAVRLLVGDVLNSDPQIQDEEIQYFVNLRGSLYGAAAEVCRALAAKFSRSVDQQAGTSKTFYSQLSKAYTLKAIEFDTKATMFGAAMPYAGGISLTDKQTQDLNSDRVKPQFGIAMMDEQGLTTNETLEDHGQR